MSLVLAVILWGASNTGTKVLVGSWPPIWTGASRFICAGVVLLLLLRTTDWLGKGNAPGRGTRRRLWLHGGLSLAAYIVAFNSALRFTSASHVALYLGAAPVWALLWEGRPSRTWASVQRYGAAFLALTGIVVLFWPVLKGGGSWLGEALGLAASVLWTNYGRQCRSLATELSGAEISAHTMWRAGVLLLPLAALEIGRQTGLPWRGSLVAIQAYCIVGGGVVTFWIWNHALKRWPTSQVLLFNNLIPLSTMSWAWACLGEPITATFWIAMILVMSGVLLGQARTIKS